MRTTLRLVAAAVTLFGLAGCSDSESAPIESTGPGTESKLIVTLSAQTDTVPEATSKPIVARVTDQTGLLKSAPLTWTSTDQSVASVSDGMITGIAPGTALVIASTGTVSDSALIVVTQNELTLDVQPNAAAVAAGDTIDFVATLRSRSGDIVSVNHFSWTSSDTAAAEFVNGSSLKTKAEGDLSVAAEALQRRGYSSVKVFRSPVASVMISPSSANVYKGDTLDLVVTLRDQYGRRLDDNVTWGSSDFTKATVTQDGLVTGLGVGSVVITATAGSKTGSATINVLSAPATSVSLTLPSDTVMLGLEMQAVATPLDANGQALTGRTIAWQSAAPSVATVTSAGSIKGIATGSSNISAIVDGIIATRRVSVRGRTATSISISPSAPAVTVGQQSQLSAKVLDQNGVEMSGQSFIWSSGNSQVALVSSAGMLSAVSAGSSSITAATAGLSATVSASIVNAPVVSVQISPSSVALIVGGKDTVSAAALDASQNVLSDRAVSWSSQNPAVATVDASGIVTAVASGSTNIVATIEGKSANVATTVSNPPPAPVASVIVSLTSSALDVGQQTQCSALLKDGQGNVLTGRAITWFSLDTAVAKVNASGLVTSYAGGTVAIMARSENVSGSASLSVVAAAPAPVAVVEIATPTQDIVVGQSVQTVVTLKDAQGNILTGRTITYTTVNSAIISISANGLVTGVGAGQTKMRATSGAITATETFRVTVPATSPTVASITVTPTTAALSVGQTSQESAVAKDAQGATISGTAFTWTTSNAAVATVNSSGLVSAIGAGSATISAAASGKTGSMSVTVSQPATPPPPPAVVATVTVSLSSTSILVGGTSQATAVAKDAQGVVITGRTVTWSGGGVLAGISSSGLVSGLAGGIVPVKATVDGINGSANLTISAVVTPPPPPASTTVELPRTYLNFSYPVKTGQTILVASGGNLQTALNNAQRGDEIVLAAGAAFSGNFTLPTKTGTAANGWIVIRGEQFAQLPPIGTRVTAANASLMPKIVTPNTAPALKTVGATSGWWLAGVEITVSSAVTAQQYGLLNLGESAAPQTTLSSVPSDIVLDRMYVHGQPTTNMSRCVALNSARTSITDSYLAECHGSGFDSQAIWGGNGPGPYKIVNNRLEGAGENIMFGGSDPAIPNLVPSDIEIRRNHIITPLAWKGVWTKKNLFELKNGVRVLVESNTFDGSWQDAQTGWAVVMKSGNQSGGCRWCRTTDVTFRRNVIQNVGGGINIAAYGDLGVAGTDTATRRIYVGENVVDVGAQPGDSRGFQMLTDVQAVTLERNVLSGSFATAALTEGGATCTFKDNVWARGQYGVLASGASPGAASVAKGCGSTYTWSGMTFVGASNGSYPGGTSWVSSESAAPSAATIRSLVLQATAGTIVP